METANWGEKKKRPYRRKRVKREPLKYITHEFIAEKIKEYKERGGTITVLHAGGGKSAPDIGGGADDFLQDGIF